MKPAQIAAGQVPPSTVSGVLGGVIGTLACG
jgi:hypothetical protein